MYEEHPEFTPPSDDAVLWRYLDFAKFIAVLENNALHFARADTLGDPYEGAYGALNAQLRSALYPDMPEKSQRNLVESLKRLPSLMYVNCWHSNDIESEAMWSLYATRDRGIAIRTTFASLRDSFVGVESVCVGEVSYINYESAFVKEGNVFAPFLHKRRSFEHEHEVRALLLHAADNGNKGIVPDLQPPGVNCDVDLPKMIEEVVVTPFAQDWLVEVVNGVASRYGLAAPVRKSALADKPIW